MLLVPPSEDDPIRQPSWRWDRSSWLLENDAAARRTHSDDYVRLAKRFQKEMRRCRTALDFCRLKQRFPDLFWAKRIHETRGVGEVLSAPAIEAYLLSGASIRWIAEEQGVREGVIAWYEALFFNVLPKLNYEGYVVNVVMGKEAQIGSSQNSTALFWKIIGYAGGPLHLKSFVRPAENVRSNHPDQVESSEKRMYEREFSKRAFIGIKSMPAYNTHATILETYNTMIGQKLAAGEAGGADMMTRNIQAALTAIQFLVGADRPDGLFKGRVNLRLDGSVEPRAATKVLQLAGAGEEEEEDEDKEDDGIAWKFPDEVTSEMTDVKSTEDNQPTD